MRSRHVRECEMVYPIISKYKTRQRQHRKATKLTVIRILRKRNWMQTTELNMDKKGRWDHIKTNGQ